MSTAGYGTNTVGTKSASLSSDKKRTDDFISDEHMEEIARRLNVTVEDDDDQKSVIRSENQPTDTKVLWQEIDENGTPIGTLKIYNEDSQAWESTGQTDVTIPSVPILQVGELIFSEASSKTVSLLTQFGVLSGPSKIGVTFSAKGAIPAGGLYVSSITLGTVSFVSTGAGTWSYIIAGQVL